MFLVAFVVEPNFAVAESRMRGVVTRSLILSVVAVVFAGAAAAQPALSRVVMAARAASPPSIDGRLDDRVWTDAEPVSGFLQRDPEEGAAATDDTVLRVAFDDHALYVAAHLRDREPERASSASSPGGMRRSRPTRSSSTSTRTTTA